MIVEERRTYIDGCYRDPDGKLHRPIIKEYIVTHEEPDEEPPKRKSVSSIAEKIWRETE